MLAAIWNICICVVSIKVMPKFHKDVFDQTTLLRSSLLCSGLLIAGMLAEFATCFMWSLIRLLSFTFLMRFISNNPCTLVHKIPPFKNWKYCPFAFWDSRNRSRNQINTPRSDGTCFEGHYKLKAEGIYLDFS